MDYSLLNSGAYQDASKLFPEVDPYQSDVLKQTLSQGETAGLSAKNTAMRHLQSQGFGASTFGDQLGTIAQAKASQPYIQSAINAAEQLKQQRVANFMNMLNAGTTYNTQQQLLEQQRKKQEQDWFTQLMGGVLPTAGAIFGGPVGGFLGKALSGGNNAKSWGMDFTGDN